MRKLIILLVVAGFLPSQVSNPVLTYDPDPSGWPPMEVSVESEPRGGIGVPSEATGIPSIPWGSGLPFYIEIPGGINDPCVEHGILISISVKFGVELPAPPGRARTSGRLVYRSENPSGHPLPFSGGGNLGPEMPEESGITRRGVFYEWDHVEITLKWQCLDGKIRMQSYYILVNVP